MVTPNELRIGNWYEDGGRIFQLEADQIPSFVYGGFMPKGIPITRDNLTKLGFKIYWEGKDYDEYINESGFKITMIYDNKNIYLELNGFAKKILFIHQLQSIHFYLTEKELQFNL